jgi:hypothetical protein
MEQIPSYDQLLRLIGIIRQANVRDEVYIQTEQSIIEQGLFIRPILLTLLSDSEKIVRDRANELLKKIPEPIFPDTLRD